MRKFQKSVLVGLLVIGTLLFVVGGTFAQGLGQPQARVITLQPVITEPLDHAKTLPMGSLTMIGYPVEKFWEEASATFQALPFLNGDFVYALYLTNAQSAAHYVPGTGIRFRYLFNTGQGWNVGALHMYLGPTPGMLEQQYVTAFVVLEKDDGYEFNEGPTENAILLMEGTSTLP